MEQFIKELNKELKAKHRFTAPFSAGIFQIESSSKAVCQHLRGSRIPVRSNFLVVLDECLTSVVLHARGKFVTLSSQFEVGFPLQYLVSRLRGRQESLFLSNGEGFSNNHIFNIHLIIFLNLFMDMMYNLLYAGE